MFRELNTQGGGVTIATHTPLSLSLQVPLGTLDSYVVQGMLRKNELVSRQVRYDREFGEI